MKVAFKDSFYKALLKFLYIPDGELLFYLHITLLQYFICYAEFAVGDKVL